MSNWSEPIILTSRFASELGARLSRLGVEPRVRFVGAGRLALSVRPADVAVLQDALSDLAAAEGGQAVVVDPLMEKKKQHLAAWNRAELGITDVDKVRLDSQWATTLDQAQAVAVNAMLEPGLLGFCLFDEQGTGKTYMGLGLVHHLFESGRANQVIVFCPASMLGEWESKLNNLPFLSSRIRGKALTLEAGDHPLSIPSQYKAIITNYRQASSRQTQLTNWAQKLDANGKLSSTVIIFDESFMVKNEETLVSVASMEIRKACSFCLMLCGTPAPNRPTDVVHQINLSDLGAALGAFRSSDDQVEDLRRLSALVDDRAAFLRRLKKDVLEFLPEKLFDVKRLEMTHDHKLLYERARSAFRNELLALGAIGVRRSYSAILTGRARLIQLCSYPSELEVPRSENTKFDALKRILDEVCVAKGQKVVVWTSYLDSIDSILQYVESCGLTAEAITGEVAPAERTEIVKRFQGDGKPQVLVCNPAAAGAGITLTKASNAVYMSYPSQAAHFLQSIDRIHRRGQTAHETKFHFLVFGRTIEDRELARLYQKEETQAELLGDFYQLPKTIEEFLAEIDG